MTAAARLLAQMPPLRAEDLERLNECFTAYLFKRANGELYATCCRRGKNILKARTVTPAERAAWDAPHAAEKQGHYEIKRQIPCPWCGRLAAPKELRYCGQRKNLWEYRRCVLLRQWRGALWALAYDLCKDYTVDIKAGPRGDLLEVCRFRPGCAEAARKRYNQAGPPTDYIKQTAPGRGRKLLAVTSPYGYMVEFGTGYRTAGAEEIAKSAFRYCGAEKLLDRCDTLRLLTACCFWPQKIEWLGKLGLRSAVEDLTERGKKNARAIHWDAQTPEDFLGAPAKVAQQLSAAGGLTALALWRKLPERARRPQEAAALGKIARAFPTEDGVLRLWRHTVGHGMAPSAVVRYLERAEAETGTRDTAAYWLDYLDAAQGVGLDLGNPLILCPRDLARKHDGTTAAWAALQNGQQDAAYRKRLKKLARRYTWSDGCYLVRPPVNGEEIKREGQALRHCVGGYADRHLAGTTTILFLRDIHRPRKPLATIEISGEKILQIHGWNNELTACKENPGRIPCRALYRDFLQAWQAWLEAGSPRDRRGIAKKIKQKEEKTA